MIQGGWVKVRGDKCRINFYIRALLSQVLGPSAVLLAYVVQRLTVVVVLHLTKSTIGVMFTDMLTS